MLADRLVELEVVDAVSDETVRRATKKSAPRPHLKEQSRNPPDANGEFVARMEDVLEAYHRPFDARRPLVCLDEVPVQLVGETRVPIPAAARRRERFDHEDARNGTANVVMAFQPLMG